MVEVPKLCNRDLNVDFHSVNIYVADCCSSDRLLKTFNINLLSELSFEVGEYF